MKAFHRLPSGPLRASAPAYEPAGPVPTGGFTSGVEAAWEELLQRGHPPLEPAVHAEASRSDTGGQALPDSLRSRMEAAFSTDFSRVRVHQDSRPSSLDAYAFTRGEHIHFEKGSWRPDTATGQRLLGHELAHVVQQRDGRVARQSSGLNESPALEAEADHLGARAAQGLHLPATGAAHPPPASTSAAPVIQRAKYRPSKTQFDRLRRNARKAMKNALKIRKRDFRAGTHNRVRTKLDAVTAINKYRGFHDEDSDATVDNTLQSPYTHNTQHMFSNLAESLALGVGPYLNDTTSKRAVRTVVRSLVTQGLKSANNPTTQRNIIKLAIAPTYAQFLTASTALGVGEASGAERLALHQLWYLEGARRRASGVANALNAIRAVRSNAPNAENVLVQQNVMSPEDASGKSKTSSKGKLARRNLTRDVLDALLNTSGVQLPAEFITVRDELAAFITQARAHGQFGQAKTTWKAQALNNAGDAMTRSASTALGADVDINALKALPEFAQLTNAFEAFMTYFYAQNRDAQALAPAPPALAAPLPRTGKFITWLVNKAASQGHQRVLTTHQGTLNNNLFIEAFRANKTPGTANALANSSALRLAYAGSRPNGNYGMLAGIKLHSNNPAQHWVPGLEYSGGTLNSRLLSAAQALRSLTQEFNRARIMTVLNAHDEPTFLTRLTGLGRGTTNPRTKARKTLKKLYRIYNLVETDRNLEAGGMHIVLANASELRSNNTAPSVGQLVTTYNVMSPQNAPTDDTVRQGQYDVIQPQLQFDHPTMDAYAAARNDANRIAILQAAFIQYMDTGNF